MPASSNQLRWRYSPKESLSQRRDFVNLVFRMPNYLGWDDSLLQKSSLLFLLKDFVKCGLKYASSPWLRWQSTPRESTPPPPYRTCWGWSEGCQLTLAEMTIFSQRVYSSSSLSNLLSVVWSTPAHLSWDDNLLPESVLLLLLIKLVELGLKDASLP
jgi:hypothetical protein